MTSSDPGAPEERRLDRLRRLAGLMDEAVRIPIIGVRFGLDPVLGLIPGLGDVAAGAVSLWIVLSAWRMGAPRPLLARMLRNIGLDVIVGLVPVLGDVFDVALKANRRNVRLLEEHLVGGDREGSRSAPPV